MKENYSLLNVNQQNNSNNFIRINFHLSGQAQKHFFIIIIILKDSHSNTCNKKQSESDHNHDH